MVIMEIVLVRVVVADILLLLCHRRLYSIHLGVFHWSAATVDLVNEATPETFRSESIKL